MFAALKLAALFVKAPLGNPPGPDREPYMIGLVFAPDILAPARIRLGEPPVMMVPLETLDVDSILVRKVFTDEFLK